MSSSLPNNNVVHAVLLTLAEELNVGVPDLYPLSINGDVRLGFNSNILVQLAVRTICFAMSSSLSDD